MERWERGELDLATEHEMRGQVRMLTELADLPFEAIDSFYRDVDALSGITEIDEDEEEANATKADKGAEDQDTVG